MKNANRWGIMSSNQIKNLKITNSKLNRVDAHRGMWNLNVSNSTIGNKGFTLIGGGTFEANNVVVDGASNIVSLRPDYGSHWNGKFILNNMTFNLSDATSPELIRFNNDGMHNFGYDARYPEVKISNLTINNPTATNKTVYLMHIDETNAGARTQIDGNLKAKRISKYRLLNYLLIIILVNLQI